VRTDGEIAGALNSVLCRAEIDWNAVEKHDVMRETPFSLKMAALNGYTSFGKKRGVEKRMNEAGKMAR
jgi:hypothetical protein